MNEKQLIPAKTVIEKAGGVKAVAEITGKHVSRVYRWMQPKDRGGTGGYVPPEEAEKLLRHSRDHGLGLTASDFFAGAA